MTTDLLRRYGRGPRGQRVSDHAPYGRWHMSTFIAALRLDGLTAPGLLEGPVDHESVLAYVEQVLVPTLRPGDLAVLDHLSAHAPATSAIAPTEPLYTHEKRISYTPRAASTGISSEAREGRI